MRTRKTLDDRIGDRCSNAFPLEAVSRHVRAELDLLARRVRKMMIDGPGMHTHNGALNDVLAIVKELKK